MSDSFTPNPVVSITRNGTPVEAVVQQVAWEVDEGWSFSATQQASAIDVYAEALSAATGANVYAISFTDGLGNSQATPDLVLTQISKEPAYSQNSADALTIAGSDLAMFKMRTSNQSFPSYAQSDAETVIGEVAARVGVTITGVPDDIYVIEEDVKNAKLADALSRFLDISAHEFAVNTSGEIVVQAWEASAGDLVFNWSTFTHNLDPRNLFTGIRLGKRSSMPASGEQVYTYDSTGVKSTDLSPSLTSPSCAVETTIEDGSANYAIFYNADNEYVAYQDFTFGTYPESEIVIPSGTGPAVRMGIDVTISGPGQVACRVRVTGTPPDTHPGGVDVEFLTPAVNTAGTDGGDTSLGVWPYESDFIDQLFPSQTYAEARRPHILSRLNADADTITMTGPLQCGSGVQLFLRHVHEGRDYKVKRIDWDFAGNQTTVNLVRLETETLS